MSASSASCQAQWRCRYRSGPQSGPGARGLSNRSGSAGPPPAPRAVSAPQQYGKFGAGRARFTIINGQPSAAPRQPNSHERRTPSRRSRGRRSRSSVSTLTGGAWPAPGSGPQRGFHENARGWASRSAGLMEPATPISFAVRRCPRASGSNKTWLAQFKSLAGALY